MQRGLHTLLPHVARDMYWDKSRPFATCMEYASILWRCAISLLFLLLVWPSQSQAQVGTFQSAKKVFGPLPLDHAYTTMVASPAGEFFVSQVDWPNATTTFSKYDSAGTLLLRTNLSIRGAVVVHSGNLYSLSGDTVRKLGAAGNIEWERIFAQGTSPSIYGRTLSVLGNGDYYIAGLYGMAHLGGGTATFGEVELPAPSGEAGNFFVAKFSSDGRLLWVRSVEPGEGSVYCAAVDAGGNLYVGGRIPGGQNVQFGGVTLMSAGEYTGGYLVKYSPDGEVVWGRARDWPVQAVVLDKEGNIFVGHEAALAKYDPTGDLLWQQAAAWNSDGGFSPKLATDSNGNVFWAGAYAAGGLSYGWKGSISFGDVTLSTTSQWETFVVKFSPAGALLWAVQSQGRNPVGPNPPRRSITFPGALAVTSTGRVLLGGLFMGTVQFGSTQLYGRDYGSNSDFYIASILDQEPLPPTLSIRRDSNGAVLEWPASPGTYDIESVDSLTPPLNWMSEPGGSNRFQIDLAKPAKFFRLKRK